MLTYDEITLYKYRNSQYLANYRTRGSYGDVCYIPPARKGALSMSNKMNVNNNSINSNNSNNSINNNNSNNSNINTNTSFGIYLHLGNDVIVFDR